jgi:hypothetical protein
LTTETKTEARERYLKELAARRAAVPLPPENEWSQPNGDWALLPALQVYAHEKRVFTFGPDDLLLTATDDSDAAALAGELNRLPKVDEALRRERAALSALRAEHQRLKDETEKAVHREAERVREHTRYWYSVRIERISQLARENGFWPQVAAILANGTATVDEQPLYAQRMNMLAHERDEARAALAASEEKARENAKLRELLWHRHGCSALYGDDGEMQCGKCLLDFKRMPVEEIERRWRDAGLAKLATLSSPSAGPASEEPKR